MLRNNLKKYRAKANCFQREAAELLGMSERQYRKLEARTPKQLEYFYTLAKRFGVTLDDLLQQADDTILTHETTA